MSRPAGGLVEDALAGARRKYRNWGRWGPDDALGTLNYIDGAKRASALALARAGRVFSLAVELSRDGPRGGDQGRGNPVHTMLSSGQEAAAGAQGFPSTPSPSSNARQPPIGATVKRADFDNYIRRFNEEDPGAFDDYLSPDVRMVNGTLELNGVGEVKEHYARIWRAMRESLDVERFVSDEQTIAIQMYTHFEVRADDPDSPFGQIKAGETFEFRGLIMYRLRADGKFADIKVAYNSFVYTSLDGTATDLGIPH